MTSPIGEKMDKIIKDIENMTLEVYGDVDYISAYIRGFQECQKRVLTILHDKP